MSEHERLENRGADHAAPNQATPGPQGSSQAATAAHERSDGTDRVFAQLQHVLRVAYEAVVRLVRIGNRRRLTLRSRTGEVWVRMPVTLVALLGLLLVPYWPLLVVLVIIGFAVGAQASVERVAPEPAAHPPAAHAPPAHVPAATEQAQPPTPPENDGIPPAGTA
jgi:hypothetical protein